MKEKQKNLPMKQVNQDKLKKIISIILVLLWMILIFYFSNQEGSTSLNSSNSIINLLNNLFQKINININLNDIDIVSFFVRKSAHMFLYFMLYLWIYYAMYEWNLKKRNWLSLIFCFIYAISDEFHQLFVPNRSFQLTDILIDTLGSSLAYLIIFFKSKFKSLKSCKL